MIAYAIVDQVTGAILQTGVVPDEAHLDIQPVAPGQIAVRMPEGVEQDAHYWTWNGFRSMPPRPSEQASWTAEGWADLRTDADRAAEIAADRASASLSKPDFLRACMAAGVLAPDEAADAAMGLIPAGFMAGFSSLPAEVQDTIRVIWPTAARVKRSDPFILALAAASGVSDETLDEIFQIEGAL